MTHHPIGTPVDPCWPEASAKATKEQLPRSSCSAFLFLPTPPRPEPPGPFTRPLITSTEELIGQALFGRRLTWAEDLLMLVVCGVLVVAGLVGGVLLAVPSG